MSIRLNNNLPTLYQEFIHLSRYSRWLEDKGRRETWNETIERYFNYFEEHLMEMHNYKLDKNLRIMGTDHNPPGVSRPLSFGELWTIRQ